MRFRASCFVLIAAMIDVEEYPAEEALRDYREQTAVVMLPDGCRALSESKMCPNKMFRAGSVAVRLLNPRYSLDLNLSVLR